MSKKSGSRSKTSEPSQIANETATKTSATKNTDGEFRDAMQGVTPLNSPKKFSIPAVHNPTQKRVVPLRAHKTQTPPFEVHRDSEQHYGHRTGLAQKTLVQLRRGDISSEREIDLHGCAEEAARTRVLAFLHAALNDRLRCVSIVHGRGLHSPNGPILKEGLLNWLEADPAFFKVKKAILAFATVSRGGATLILFKHKRE